MPEPLSEAKLKFLMRDKRYWHPRHADPAFQAMITEGFRSLYPTPGRQAESGQGSPGGDGPVHVDAHKRSGVPVSEYYRNRPGQGGSTDAAAKVRRARTPLPPPDRNDVTAEELYNILDFDPGGMGEDVHASLSPAKGMSAFILSEFAHAATKRNFPTAKKHNDEADAFRHAYFSFEMTQHLGVDAAKRFGDAHEISGPNHPDERMMDLYNNHVGRQLAKDPANIGKSPEQVVMEALRAGRLRTRPYPTGK